MENTMEIIINKLDEKFGKTEVSKNNSAIDAMVEEFIKKANEKKGAK